MNRRRAKCSGGTISRLLVRLSTSIILLVVSMPDLNAGATGGQVGPKKYYLALGDSLAYGFQPNDDMSHGYTDQWFDVLRHEGVESMVNLSCTGETTGTFINGACPFRLQMRSPHVGTQLQAAVRFLRAHPGEVSPVSLDIGANDILWVSSPDLCIMFPWLVERRLQQMDRNLTEIVFPRLIATLTDDHLRRTGDLVLVNYYNPVQYRCPNFDRYFQELNEHLARDAAQFGIPVADIYSAFNADPPENQTLCHLTWICDSGNIHASGGQPGEPGNGYGVIARVLEETLGY